MEELLYRLTENSGPHRRFGHSGERKHRSHSQSSVDIDFDSEVDSQAGRRRWRKDTPSKYGYNFDSMCQEEEFQVTSFEKIMVGTFRTLSQMLEDGEDVTGIISHGQYMAEKAAADVYIPDAFTGYDRYVRQVASRKGPKAFASMSELERSRFFNLEYYREVCAFRARNKSQQPQKQKTGTCRRYNSDNGCFARNCLYVHRCANCEAIGHLVKDCKSHKKEGSQNK